MAPRALPRNLPSTPYSWGALQQGEVHNNRSRRLETAAIYSRTFRPIRPRRLQQQLPFRAQLPAFCIIQPCHSMRRRQLRCLTLSKQLYSSSLPSSNSNSSSNNSKLQGVTANHQCCSLILCYSKIYNRVYQRRCLSFFQMAPSL